MAKRSAPEPNDSDRIEGFAHPRETFELLGQDAPLGRAARAIRGGRPPGAWLITGAPGVGKATLAYRMARRLLGARPEPSLGLLGAAPSDVVSRQVAARSHPDLMVLERLTDDGKGPEAADADDPLASLGPLGVSRWGRAGLGLAIAERCARGHGGELRLQGGPSQGMRAALVLGQEPA